MSSWNVVYRVSENTGEKHPLNRYDESMHVQNLVLADNFLESNTRTFDNPGETRGTPWMLSVSGLARVVRSGDLRQVEMVEERASGVEPGLADHLIKHTVKLTEETMEGSSKIYLPVRQFLGILFFNHPVSAGWMAGYPTLNGNPPRVAAALKDHLAYPDEVTPASKSDLGGLFAKDYPKLRYWARVKIED